MCLAVPGKLVAVKNAADGDACGALGTVDFQGSRVEVSLAFTPEAREGDWVLVHAGFALQLLDEQAARETWQYLEEADIAEAQAGGFAASGGWSMDPAEAKPRPQASNEP